MENAAKLAAQSSDGQAAELKKRKGADLSAPEGGWKKLKRESEMVWFARLQAHRHGSEKKKQKDYIDQWKGFDEKHRRRFRDEIDELCAADCAEPAGESESVPVSAGMPPWCVLRDDRFALVMPDGYSLDDLQRDFGAFAENPQAHDQKRWEFYGLLFQLIGSGTCDIKNANQAESKLKSLRVNKHYLYKIRDAYGHGELPWDVPSMFKMGRTPQTSLTEREKKDLLLYVKWHQRTGTALSVQQVEDAAMLLKLEKFLGIIKVDVLVKVFLVETAAATEI